MNSTFRSKRLPASRATQYVLTTLVAAILIVGAWPAWGGPQQGGQQGTRLRLELAGYRAFDVDKANGDYYLTGAVELEIPVVKHATLGLRLLPLLLYPDKEDHPDVYGIAAGVGGRLYSGQDNTGLFVEAGVSALWSMDKLRIDDSKVGFLGDCGIGYEFRSGVHLSVKAQHISDAGIGEVTSGTNGLGVAAGYRF